MRAFRFLVSYGVITSLCAGAAAVIVVLSILKPANADAPANSEHDGSIVYESERIFLSCTVFQDRHTGEKSLAIENNTGRVLPVGWPVYYQKSFDRAGPKTLLRFDEPLQIWGEERLSIGADELTPGNCNAWAMIPKEPLVVVDLETRGISRE